MLSHHAKKSVYILGGSCDLAISLAKVMIEENYMPILSFRNSKGRIRIENELGKTFDKYHLHALDLEKYPLNDPFSNSPNIKIDALIDFGHTDFENLVASANDPDIYHYFNTNIASRAVLIKHVARQMLTQKKGRFIYISSTAACAPNKGQGFYTAAKLASEALYHNLGLELGGRGITTVSLRLGYVKSGRGKRYLEKNQDSIIKKMPTSQIITPDEVIQTILFLLRNTSSSFNATSIKLDGGFTSGK